MVSKIDNEKWVADNLVGKFDAKDVHSVLYYVISNHPFHGCSDKFPKRIPMKKLKKASLLEISLYADAVTIFCFEEIGKNELLGGNYYFDPSKTYNITSFGNAAYIALNHSSPEVRNLSAKIIEDFKKSA